MIICKNRHLWVKMQIIGQFFQLFFPDCVTPTIPYLHHDTGGSHPRLCSVTPSGLGKKYGETFALMGKKT